MKLSAFWLSLLTLAGCSSLPPTRPASAAPARNTVPAGIEGALGPQSMVLLGEPHGTREIPRFAAELTGARARRGPVVLALEVPRGLSGSLNAYLASDGSPAARARALAEPFWRAPFQDGRRSVAMFELVEATRALRLAGASVDLLCFDLDEAGAGQEAREQAMADAIVGTRQARPEASFVVLTGNLHASKREVPFVKGFRWMAMRIADAGLAFVSLDARYAEGSAWTCRDADASRCGPSFAASPHRPTSGVHLEPSSDGRYDGWFGLGAVAASPPAALPERAAGLEQKLAALAASPEARRSRARTAYDAGDFRGCAASIGQITEPTVDDAYTEACCLARAGERDAAVARLRFAVERGLENPGEADNDDDLVSLRDHPRWPFKK